MSGRKTFTAGEVLQAADVNDFLMDQSVMVFAGTAARGSAIPSPTEGMVTYRSDDDTVEVYDGSSFKPVGGLVKTHSVMKTDTFSATIAAGGGSVAVTGLSISNVALSNSSNKLIISAFFGAAAHSNDYGQVGIAVSDGTNLLSIADSDGVRTRTTAGGFVVDGSGYGVNVVSMPHITISHSPGDTTSRTYTVHAIDLRGVASQTVYVNRNEADTNITSSARAASGLHIMEVAV